jgi:hypothetical protein
MVSYLSSMFFALIALQLLGNADSVQIGAGQAINQAVTASLKSNRLPSNQATEQGAERYTVQVYAGRRIDANSLFLRLTDFVGTVLPVVIYFDEPQFKVFVGIYGSRIEAEYALRKWRANFPTSFAVQAPNERFKKTASSN